MGTWSEDIFGNDMACDVRDAYCERIKSGEKPDVALKQVKKEFAEELRNADDKRTIFIALAAAQFEAGGVIATVRETALKSIAWCENPNRDAEEFPFALEALAKLREKLGGKAPPPPPLKPPRLKLPPGEPGDVYAITLPEKGFSLKLRGKPTEAVIFVGRLVKEGGRPPGTARVVLLPDLAVKAVTPEAVVKALSEWRHYRQKWPNSMGRSILCYDGEGKLPPRKTRLLLRGIEMPKDFARRMKSLGAVYKSAELPFVVDKDLWDWNESEWVIDSTLDTPA